MGILLKNACIITVDPVVDVIKEGCIGIKQDTIDYVGGYFDGIEAGYEKVLDCGGKIVMPGMINAHNHASMTMFRNYADDMKLMDWLFNKIFPLEDKLTSEAAYWAAKLAILEMIKSGTTTFCDMYMFMDRVAEAVCESGIRGVLSRGLTGDKVTHEDIRVKEALELYDNYNGAENGRIKVILAAHAVYTCSPEYLRNIVAISEKKNMPMQIHLSETKDEVSGCVEKYGKRPVALLDETGFLKPGTVAAHGVHLNDEEIDILAERKVSIVHNPGSNMKLASGIAPVCKMIEKGVNVCLGTDGASSNNNLDMLEEMRMAAYLQKVILEDSTALLVDVVLRMATVNGAAALGLENLGMIRAGMKADMIVFNAKKAEYFPKYCPKSAIVYSGNSAHVETVIIDGKIVMQDGEILTLDEEKILFETQKWSEKITS